MRKQLDNMILPLTDDLKCLNIELNNTDTSTSLLLNNKSDDELKFLLTESVDSNFTLNDDEESDKMVSNQNNNNNNNNNKENSHLNLQSENVLIAVMALIKDLNLDGLNMVIKECEFRKTLFYKINNSDNQI
jgi:hypothetical protein